MECFHCTRYYSKGFAFVFSFNLLFFAWVTTYQPVYIQLNAIFPKKPSLILLSRVEFPSWNFFHPYIYLVVSLVVVQLLSRFWLCNSMDCSTPDLPVHHQVPEFTQTHVRWVSDAIQPSHPLSSPSPPAPNPSQHQGLVKWVSSLHQVAKGLKFQLQYQSFQWTPRIDLL